jgi:hypothetical protein
LNPYNHPARFTDTIIAAMRQEVCDYRDTHMLQAMAQSLSVLDPMAGVGTIHDLNDCDYIATFGIEIEPLWADAHPRTMQGDATALPWQDDFFDVIAVSPVYGNRMSDHHNAKDGSRRTTYTHNLRAATGDDSVALQANNAGRLYAYRDDYWDLHAAAWEESVRVLRSGGMFLLNTSDFVRNGERVRVTQGHVNMLVALGLVVRDWRKIETPRMRYGQNSAARVDAEDLVVFDK